MKLTLVFYSSYSIILNMLKRQLYVLSQFLRFTRKISPFSLINYKNENRAHKHFFNMFIIVSLAL